MSQSEHDQAETRRDRRIQRKREEILIAATRIFAMKGFAGTTTKDIADAADIGESTLYNYFDSKRDILLAIIREHTSPLDTMVYDTKGLVSRDELIDLVEHGLDLFTAKVLLVRAILLEACVDDDILKNFVAIRVRKISQTLQEFIEAQINAGRMRPVDPALTARFGMGMFFALVMPAVRGIEPPPAPEQRRVLAEAMVSLMLDGVGTGERKSS